jgi:hypothetical protein
MSSGAGTKVAVFVNVAVYEVVEVEAVVLWEIAQPPDRELNV